MTTDTGFDQHDLDHMDDEGSTVFIAYVVIDRHGHISHVTDLKVDGPAFAAALRPIANPGPQD